VDLIFTRTGSRRYAVTARRAEHPDVACSPAPGFHDRIPHDLVHLVAERRFGLRDGIYGALAAGGDAGTFLPVERSYDRRYARRTARRSPPGLDMARSERLAALLHVRWCRRHGHGEGAVVDHGALPHEPEARDLRALEAALDDLDGFAQRWGALAVGASAHEEWPWPERPASHRRRG
jgi:hypothetical protein